MKLTTKGILQLLPVDGNLKKELLDNWDKMEPDQRANLEQLVWDTYRALYKLRLEEKLRLELAKLGRDEGTLEPALYSRLQEETDREMASENFSVSTSSELTSIREKLQTFLKDKST